jgi:PAS domain S-box-containing protein
MLTIGIDEASRNLADTIARVAGDRQPLGIGENGSAEVVLIPAAELARLRNIAASSPAQALFDRAGRMAKLGYWEWDEIAYRCVECSEELARIYGITQAQCLERLTSMQAWLDWIHPDDRAYIEKVEIDSRARNSGYDVEYRLQRDDGTVLHVREVAEPVLDAEHELKESEALLRSIYAQIPGAVYRRVLHADGSSSYPFVSSGAHDLLGLSPEEMMTDANIFSDSMPASDRERRARDLRHSAETLERYDGEFRYILPNGETIWLRTIADPERMDDGDIVWTGLTLDVTERKRLETELRRSRNLLEERVRERTAELAAANEALRTEVAERRETETALRDSEEQLRLVTDNLPILIGLVDREERFVWCNNVLGEWMARPREEIIGRRQSEVDSPADYKAIEPWVRAVLSGKRTENENTIDYPDGVTRHVLRVSVPAFGPDGLVTGYYFFIHDITEHKKAEQAMREYSDRLELIADNLPVLIAYVDADERFKFVNRRCCEWYARAPEDIIEKRVEDIHRDTYAKFKARFRRVKEDGPVEFEDRITYPDGVTRDVRATYLPHHAADGTVVGIFSLVEAEERARQSQKMEAVGQLTGGVAHDFNNLLAVIIGNAEILVEDIGNEDHSVNAILRAARRGTELTQRLLAFSRRQPLDPRPTDLNELVGGMSAMLRRTLGESIEIAVTSEEGLWPAMVDPGQVENALLNLAINARDAMPGSGRLTIECMNARLDDAYLESNADASPGEFSVLAVSDNGTGMPPSVLEHVFEPFFTTKEVGQGTGLGLSMIYGFAKQSGGHVAIFSEEGIGTTVKLYLPRARDVVISCKPEDLADLPRGRGETVLVLEDDNDVRALAVRILEGLRYRVIEASRAEAADRALAEADQVDLLLSDVVLPGKMNGPDFARQARETHPALKILFMSGYPAEAARRDGFADLGGAPLLRKPLDRRQLAEALKAALRD